jgi:tetratricopeptide (TPR) repeat protein
MIKNAFQRLFALCFGFLLALLLIEISLWGLGWYQNNRNLFTRIAVKNNNEIRILSLGDSVTALGDHPRYPEELQTILSNFLPNKKIIVYNKGVVKSASGNLLYNLENDLDKYHPDVVTVMIGNNDFGSVVYEDSAGIRSTDIFSRLKTYKLFKFLFKSIQDKLKGIKDTAIKKDYFPKSENDLVSLGKDAYKNGQINNSIDYFEKALQINPNNDQAYSGLGLIYKTNGEISKALEYLKKGIGINPNNGEAFLALGQLSEKTDEPLDKRIWYLQQAIRLNPDKFEPYSILAMLYENNHMEKQALEIRSHKFDSAQSDDYILTQARYNTIINNESEAIKLFNQAFSSTKDSYTYISDIQLLAELYKSQGKTKEAEETLNLVTKSSGALAQNYQKIADILAKRGIILLAVQYPMRDITPLKIILRNTDAIFVDNDKSFKKAVAKNGFDKIFVDHFAGDFGHLTAEGHRIVAQNIADVLMKKVFKK